MYYIDNLKRELVDTNAYKLQPSLSERVIVDRHGCHTALHFGVKAKENQDKVPTLYWLPKLHKKIYKERFIANSSSCTATELSKLLTLCLTAVKNMLSNIVKRYMRDLVKKVSNGAKIRNRYNQAPHLTQDTNGKVTNSQKTPQTRAKRSALSQQVTTKHI